VKVFHSSKDIFHSKEAILLRRGDIKEKYSIKDIDNR